MQKLVLGLCDGWTSRYVFFSVPKNPIDNELSAAAGDLLQRPLPQLIDAF